MINSVVLTGRLTKDPETKMTQNGKQVSSFTLAVNRTKEQTDFIRCKAFGKTAELAGQYLRKGSLVGVTGSIWTGSYQNQQGATVYTTDVVVNQLTFLEKAPERQNANTGYYQGSYQQQMGYQSPYAQQTYQTNSQPAYQQGYSQPADTGGLEVSPDDLPF